MHVVWIIIKKNTFSFAATKQLELIKILLKNIHVDDLKKWMKQVKEDFDNTVFTKEELTISQRLSQPVNEYKSKTLPLHVRLARDLEEKTGENLVKTEIEYIVTGMEPVMQGIMATDYKNKYDKEYYWDNKTRPVLERLTEAIYPDIDFYSKQLKLF